MQLFITAFNIIDKFSQEFDIAFLLLEGAGYREKNLATSDELKV